MAIRVCPGSLKLDVLDLLDVDVRQGLERAALAPSASTYRDDGALGK